jgi:hypothetical protein
VTQDHDFKALVRARMAKTGESYTTARRQLRAGDDGTVDARRHKSVAVAADGHVEVRFGQRPRRPDDALLVPGGAIEPSQRVVALEVEDDAIRLEADGSVVAYFDDPVDLVIEANGHVAVSDGAGVVTVMTSDGHIDLRGRFDDVVAQTADGHVWVDSTHSASIVTADGHVEVVLAGQGAAVDITAERLSVSGGAEFTGSAREGHWAGMVGQESDELLAVQAIGKVAIRLG